MSKISSSPERHTFQAESTKKKLAENPHDEGSKALLEWYERIKIDEAKRIEDPEWQKNNLEYDLRSTPWICEKVQQSEIYAQNLYAALCNNDFLKMDIIPILKGDYWSCSWRYAGGIIADMRREGDYIDWYCSGIKDSHDGTDERMSAPEGAITREVREDLLRLGWKVVESQD